MGIYVWGTGCGASELLEQGFDLERVEAFVDSFPAVNPLCGMIWTGSSLWASKKDFPSSS